ncbi:MAG: hypothetical protein ACRDLO_06425 [Solirubrobacterales bacterium]
MRARRGRETASLVAACALLIAGCGGGADEPDATSEEPTDFARALEGIGQGVAPEGTGFGWIDIAAIREAAGPDAVREVAPALGPGADELLERVDGIQRAIGFDPLAADAVTSLGASYAFGVRFQGVRAARLGALLSEAGARDYPIGAWTGYDLGEQGQAVTSGGLAALDSLGSRVAIRPGAAILARVDSARHALLGLGGSPLADDKLAFATACLGDVDAARTLPGGFTHNAVASPALIAIGRRPGPPSARGEVLCAIGDSEADAERQVAALTEAFAPGAAEPLTGEPMSELVAGAEIDQLADGELHAARATLDPAPAAPPGLLFRALVRGGVLPDVGAPEPIP